MGFMHLFSKQVDLSGITKERKLQVSKVSHPWSSMRGDSAGNFRPWELQGDGCSLCHHMKSQSPGFIQPCTDMPVGVLEPTHHLWHGTWPWGYGVHPVRVLGKLSQPSGLHR